MTTHIPWRAWFGDERLPLTFPDEWQVQVCAMQDAPALNANAIRSAVENSIASPRLRELARGRRSAIIAVDDLARPTPAAEALPFILNELSAGGVREENIRIVCAVGGHRPLSPEEMEKKLGREVVGRFAVSNHNPFEDLVEIGTLGSSGVPLRLNRAYVEADLKVVVGSVIPHPFAGFSGGAKAVFPGLAGIEGLERNHRAALMNPRAGVGALEGNRTRAEIERIARQSGLDFTVNVVVNSRREVAGVFAGDLMAAHRDAVACARRVYATPLPRNVDVALLNAYPKDTELLQIDNAFNLLRSAGESLVKEEGVVVVCAACTLGEGHHALFGPGGRLYRPPSRKRYLGDRRLIAFVPGVSDDEFRRNFWEGYSLCSTWEQTRAELESKLRGACQVALFPCASLQMGSEASPRA